MLSLQINKKNNTVFSSVQKEASKNIIYQQLSSLKDVYIISNIDTV